MELELLRHPNLSKRKRNWILLLTAVGLSGYGAYRVYHTPIVARKRKQLFKLFKASISIVESIVESAETIGVVSRDLKRFLQSNSDHVATSVKQRAKVTKSEEFSGSLVRVTEGLTIGVLRGFNSESRTEKEATPSGFPERLLDKLFSQAGSGFASVVVGSFARSLVMAFYSEEGKSVIQLGSKAGSDGGSVPAWLSVVCSGKCRELIADCIQLFVCTAVAVYLEKTMDINTYDEIFSCLTNPKHESKVKDILVSFCNGAVETLVKTCHKVLTKASSHDQEEGPSLSGNEAVGGSFSSASEALNTDMGEEKSLVDWKDRSGHSGWANKVSSTLAVPRNRRFLLDVTGRVTFESVRCFLDILLWKLVSDILKRGFHVSTGGAIEKGLEITRLAGAKSIVIATICLALCLQVIVGTRALTPA